MRLRIAYPNLVTPFLVDTRTDMRGHENPILKDGQLQSELKDVGDSYSYPASPYCRHGLRHALHPC